MHISAQSHIINFWSSNALRAERKKWGTPLRCFGMDPTCHTRINQLTLGEETMQILTIVKPIRSKKAPQRRFQWTLLVARLCIATVWLSFHCVATPGGLRRIYRYSRTPNLITTYFIGFSGLLHFARHSIPSSQNQQTTRVINCRLHNNFSPQKTNQRRSFELEVLISSVSNIVVRRRHRMSI